MRILVYIIVLATCINFFDCAKDSRKLGRIVRGHDAVIGQFPYVVRLSVEVGEMKMGCVGCITCPQRKSCGGALISPNWVLTAAHCIAEYVSRLYEDTRNVFLIHHSDQPVKVHLGSISKYRPKVVYDVSNFQIRIHPRYERHSGHNDIALVNIPYTKLCSEIGIVRLPKYKDYEPKFAGAYAIACGWGRKSQHGSLPGILQWGRLQILPSDKCRYLGIIETQICTNIRPYLATVGHGDSGAPLVLETTGKLVGIASNGDESNCENGDSPIFTRVTSYLNWIKSASGISYG